MNALIVGGTHGIGRATAYLLSSKGWNVVVYGRNDYNVLTPSNADHFRLKSDAHRIGGYDAFVYSAGDIEAIGVWAFQFPIVFYNLITNEYGLFNDGCAILAISSVAAERPAKQYPHYAAAKAALESYVRTLADSELCAKHKWKVEYIRFDLVRTQMYAKLKNPVGQAIYADAAAQDIVDRIEEMRR